MPLPLEAEAAKLHNIKRQVMCALENGCKVFCVTLDCLGAVNLLNCRRKFLKDVGALWMGCKSLLIFLKSLLDICPRIKGWLEFILGDFNFKNYTATASVLAAALGFLAAATMLRLKILHATACSHSS